MWLTIHRHSLCAHTPSGIPGFFAEDLTEDDDFPDVEVDELDLVVTAGFFGLAMAALEDFLIRASLLTRSDSSSETSEKLIRSGAADSSAGAAFTSGAAEVAGMSLLSGEGPVSSCSQGRGACSKESDCAQDGVSSPGGGPPNCS